MSNDPKRMKWSPSWTTTEKKEANIPATEIGPTLSPTRKSNRQVIFALGATHSVNLSHPKASQPLNGMISRNHEAQEYSCKYCPKKFYSKQSLGGHQTAHRIRQANVTNEREGCIRKFRFTGGPSSPGISSPRFSAASHLMLKGVNPQSFVAATQHTYVPKPHELNHGYMGCTHMVNPLFTDSQIIDPSPETENEAVVVSKSTTESNGLINETENQPDHDSDLDLTLKL